MKTTRIAVLGQCITNLSAACLQAEIESEFFLVSSGSYNCGAKARWNLRELKFSKIDLPRAFSRVLALGVEKQQKGLAHTLKRLTSLN